MFDIYSQCDMTGISFLKAIVKFIFLTVESVICLSAIFIYYVNSEFDFFSEDMIETKDEIHVSYFFFSFSLIFDIFSPINKTWQTEYYPAGTFILIWNFRNSLS